MCLFVCAFSTFSLSPYLALFSFLFLFTVLGTFAARGFGMRVVGGKTGADGRLFAYLVWTVPGGPAEKGGLQQGDKVYFILE